MVVAILGESCTGKSTLAAALTESMGAKVYTGKDYVRLAKNEADARAQFVALLHAAQTTEEMVVYVISEREYLALLPPKAVRVLMTADLPLIKERFARRMNGNLPAPVAAMLEKKHGSFEQEAHDMRIDHATGDPSEVCQQVVALARAKNQLA